MNRAVIGVLVIGWASVGAGLYAQVARAAEPQTKEAKEVKDREPVDLLAPGDLSDWVEEQHGFFRTAHPDVQRTWTLADGILKCDGSHGNCGFLRYEPKLCDFQLELEFRVAKGCNSGVGLRAKVPYTTLNPNTLPSNVGFEFQIMDDAGQPASATGSGAFYGKLAPKANAAKPAGEWNQLTIECRGSRVRATLNRQLVQDIDYREVPALADRAECGYLSLQNHGHDCEFRNLRLTEFATTK